MCIRTRLLVLARPAAMAGLFLACCCPGLAQAPKEPPPIGAVFSPDAGLLATTRSDAKIIIWEVATGKEKLRFDVEDRNFAILFSPDGKVLATIGRTKPTTAIIWDVATGKKLPVLKNREGEFAGLVFSGDHQCAAAANPDGTVSIWSDLREEPKTVAAAVSKPAARSTPFLGSACVFSADSKMVITGGWDGTVRVWDVPTGRERATLVTGSNKRGEFQTPKLTLGADGKSIITVSSPFREPMGQCVVWDLTTFEETVSAKTLKADALHSLVTPPDGSVQALLVGKVTATAVVIRNPADGKQRVLCEEPPEKRLHLAFSRDGKKLLVIVNVTATVWDLTNDRILMKPLQAGPGAKKKEYCYPGLFSADGSLLIGSGISGLVRIWDVGKETSRIDINVSRPSNLLPPVVAPDGRSVFAGDALWDAATGKIRARINHELPKSD